MAAALMALAWLICPVALTCHGLCFSGETWICRWLCLALGFENCRGLCSACCESGLGCCCGCAACSQTALFLRVCTLACLRCLATSLAISLATISLTTWLRTSRVGAWSSSMALRSFAAALSALAFFSLSSLSDMSSS